MQNSNTKLKKGIVGVDAHIDPKNKGITLIALIITIIVMLILVAVTINVAMSGGLFGTANTAARDTEELAIYDQIVGAMQLANDGKIKVSETYTAAKTTLNGQGKTVKPIKPEDEKNITNSIVFEVTGNKGKYTYTIKQDEIIIGKKDAIEELKKYILGQELQGRNLTEILDTEKMKFIDDETTNVNGVEFLKAGENEDGSKGFVYAEYDTKEYKITIDTKTFYTEKLELIYEPKGREGEDLGEITGNATYKGWIILYDNGETVEAVSPTAMGNLTLGREDTTIDWTNIKETSSQELKDAKTEADLDGNGTVDSTENSIYSYNHAITTINDYCKNLEELQLSENIKVRSVGAKTDTTTNMYSNIPKSWTAEKYNEKIKTGDTNYKEDLVRISYWEIKNNNQLEIGTPYWIASRVIEASSQTIDFCIRVGHGLGDVGSYDLLEVWDKGYEPYRYGIGVRPIITVPII